MSKINADTSGTLSVSTNDWYNTVVDIQHDSMSQSIANLTKAQAKVMAKASTVRKDALGQFSYTSMDALLPKIKKMLANEGISFFQMPVGDANEIGIRTIYAHSSGEWISSSYRVPIIPNPRVSVYQNCGQAITYFRRYALMSFVGLASGKDDDGVLEEPALTKAEIDYLKQLQDKIEKLFLQKAINAERKAHLIEFYLKSVKDDPSQFEKMTGLLEKTLDEIIIEQKPKPKQTKKVSK